MPLPVPRLTPVLPLASCLLLLSFGTATSQPGVQKGNSPTVNVLVSVVDKDGRPVTNLKETDFRIREDGKLQTITSFVDASAEPLSVALIVDRSGSTKAALQQTAKAFDAAMTFFRSSVQPGRDTIALVAFDNSVTLDWRNFSDNLSQLPQAISDTLNQAFGGSALYDALAGAARLLQGRQGRRFIFIVSDGDDNRSRTSAEEAMRAVQRGDIGILAVSTPGIPIASRTRGSDFLEALAEETGGQFFPSFAAREADRLREEFAAQYAIQYQSTNTKVSGKHREIRVEPVNRNHRIRHRTRYWNE